MNSLKKAVSRSATFCIKEENSKFENCRPIFRYFKRRAHAAASASSENNVLSSKHPDVVIPNWTLNDYIWEKLDKWPNKTAVVCGITGRGYTYEQAFDMSTRFAACLRVKLGLVDGDCVAIMMPNMPEFPLAAIGAVQAGAVVTTVNPLYTPEEVRRQLLMSGAKILITTSSCYNSAARAVQGIQSNIKIVVVKENGDSLPEGCINFAEFAENFDVDRDCLKRVSRSHDDVVLLPFSSGTTGLPKGVELTHRNIIANSEQILVATQDSLIPTTADYQDTIPSVLPFFHIYGLVVTLINKLVIGLKIVTLPKFTPETFLNAQLKHHGTILFVAPPLVLFLSSHPGVTADHLRPLRSIISGAAPLAASDAQRLVDKFQLNLQFSQGYGLTETSPVVTLQTSAGVDDLATVGSLMPSTSAKVVDLSTQEVLGPNKVGELWVKGPQVMKGYHDDEAATQEVLQTSGWLRTGDLGYYNQEEQLFITGRLKELIKVKGYQVPPAELEGILREHPAIADAAVVGVPDAICGEVPKAFIVPRNGQKPDVDEIKKFVADKVAPYKKIAQIQFIASIPKNASGKIMRKHLKEHYS